MSVQQMPVVEPRDRVDDESAQQGPEHGTDRKKSQCDGKDPAGEGGC